MKHILGILFLCIICNGNIYAQKPQNGTYVYHVASSEWHGKSLGATVLVKIKGDSIYVIHNVGNLSGKVGEMIDCGVIMKHRKIGKWIIGHNAADKNAQDVGGCSGGPSRIDFRHKKFWLC
ncbi:hypothetical protein [Chitinophaga rhizophila]|uniref:Uncharacterized protein n=1 Tax=Chitinophaga rhizophila TaxID=2866212 RepID=A0ABS7GJM5_9BACT|nr:hypothetical protein [Chitinophaga rhizophila]MBW8687910.1 hypothetical protein [Chitinophaga rhizophila]